MAAREAVAARTAGHAPIDAAAAWAVLSTLMDPEVPVVSIVELGIVRDVDLHQGRVCVTITPTYAGCPAMDRIASDLRDAFAQGGIAVDVVTTLAPAWTTDWMAPEARQRLAAYGIAPPHCANVPRIDVTAISPLRRRPQPVACPRCGSLATTLLAQFGSTACKALFRCDECREPFDYFKPH